MLYTLRFFSSKCSLFHNANLFGSYIIHILYTGCVEIKKNNNSGAKGLRCLLLSPAMRPNPGMAKQTEWRRIALSCKSTSSFSSFVGWVVDFKG